MKFGSDSEVEVEGWMDGAKRSSRGGEGRRRDGLKLSSWEAREGLPAFYQHFSDRQDGSIHLELSLLEVEEPRL